MRGFEGPEMERSLPILSSSEPAPTCVWMDAGVLSYRLCNRGFACETCPLDAAIRSDPRRTAPCAAVPAEVAATCPAFPDDRLYADSHLWVQIVGLDRARVGLDAFAASLLAPVDDVPSPVHVGHLHPGDRLCTLRIIGGEVQLLSPVSGEVRGWNQRLMAAPAVLTTEPYSAGWLAEIALTQPGELFSLRHADAAMERARLSWRRFGRQTALALLAGELSERMWLEPCLLDAARRTVGAASFATIVRDALG